MGRKITLTLDFTLRRGSQQAHQVTVERLAEMVGRDAIQLFEGHGYSIQKAAVNTLLHTVRHSTTKTLRRLTVVRKAG